MVSMLIAVNDWIHDSYIIKSVVAALGSVLGCIAIATYLVLPRLALNQHSVFSIDADLPKDHLTANRFIPNINSVTIIYWTYTIVIFSYTLILSILKGYFQGTGEENPFNIVYTLLNIGLGISDVLGIVCFIKYGRLIIKLLDESATLIGLPTAYSLLVWVFGFFYCTHEKCNSKLHAVVHSSGSYKLRWCEFYNVDHISWDHLRV
ncbi:6809_t:CDS:2, partial [Gigaspora margarita]